MSSERINQAKVLLQEGKKREARELLQKIISADPHNESAWLWFIDTLLTDAERVTALEKCLKLNPNSKIAQRGLALLQKKQSTLSRLGELRKLAEQMVRIFENAQKVERDKEYMVFLGKQADILRKALHDSATPGDYKVAIVGSFKVGKSSFVNALCDMKNLASVNANPETAAITIFRYDNKAHAEIHMTSKKEWNEMKWPRLIKRNLLIRTIRAMGPFTN